nr:MAG: replication initiator protein [Microvirus sp.]
MCKKPVRIFKNLDSNKYPMGLLVPCGKCLDCRIHKRNEWSVRLLHESEFWENSIFLTLTYDDYHLPENNSLRKRHLQLFFKRLRKNTGKKIKYFACGEYGDNTERPHYHSIVFGLGYNDIEDIKLAWTYCNWDIPTISNKSFGKVEPDSIRYVCQYIDKKLSGEKADEEYDNKKREPVFKIQSNGLSLKYIEKYKDGIFQRSYITVNGNKRSIPRYYINKAEIDNNEMHEYAEKKERELTEHLLGVYLSLDEAYLSMRSDDYLLLEERLKDCRLQNDKNLSKRLKLKSRNLL